MAVNIYVGNLSYDASDEDLRAAFEPFGQVTTARVIKDRETGRSRGFGFVEMPNADEARKAIEKVNNKDVAGRPVRVNEARPRDEGPRRY
jgi:RNA recognition motif-containing protein